MSQRDRAAYEQSYPFARIGTELAAAAIPFDKLKYAGTILAAMDLAQNAQSAGAGIGDMMENGVNIQNGLQTAAGLIGAGLNTAALRRQAQGANQAAAIKTACFVAGTSVLTVDTSEPRAGWTDVILTSGALAVGLVVTRSPDKRGGSKERRKNRPIGRRTARRIESSSPGRATALCCRAGRSSNGTD